MIPRIEINKKQISLLGRHDISIFPLPGQQRGWPDCQHVLPSAAHLHHAVRHHTHRRAVVITLITAALSDDVHVGIYFYFILGQRERHEKEKRIKRKSPASSAEDWTVVFSTTSALTVVGLWFPSCIQVVRPRLLRDGKSGAASTLSMIARFASPTNFPVHEYTRVMQHR
jgi:hypothetical protein